MNDSPQQEQTTEEESTNKETIYIHFPPSQTASSTEPANDESTQPVIEPANDNSQVRTQREYMYHQTDHSISR